MSDPATGLSFSTDATVAEALLAVWRPWDDPGAELAAWVQATARARAAPDRTAP